jgi:hypothetical protein
MDFVLHGASGADRINWINWMFFLFSLSGRKGERESAFGGGELWAGGLPAIALARPPSASPQAFAGRAQARRAGKSPLSFCSPFFEPRSREAQSSPIKYVTPLLNALRCHVYEFPRARRRKAFMSGGLNAGHNHSSPEGQSLLCVPCGFVVYGKQRGILKIAGFLKVSFYKA